jgi:hypothetical protein
MKRTISVFLPVAGEASHARSRFGDDPGTWLPPDHRQAGPNDWWVDVHAAGVYRTVRCHVGDLWVAGESCWRTLVWTPSDHSSDAVPMVRLLPTLVGELGVSDHQGKPSLVLTGTYTPPAAAFGALADAAVMKRVAHTTATHFLVDIAGALQAAPVP